MKAFLDIDTQIDFVFPAGALYTPGAETVLPAVVRLNQYASANNIPLISTMCAHGENAREFAEWPPHCVIGTVGQQKPAATLVPHQTFIEKDELNVFSNPKFLALLDELSIEECTVYGVLTEYCVKCAVMGLLEHGRKVTLVSDAIWHHKSAAGEQVIRDFLAAGGQTARVDSVVL